MQTINELKFAEEIKKMEYEPLNATEISLVKWSLTIGVSLLVILYFVADFFFPGAHG